MKRVFILGADGFIGSHLVRAILDRTDWHVVAIDLGSGRIEAMEPDPRLEFRCADVAQERDWVEQQVARCDVVVPLMAIATPASFVRDPLSVFRITFQENLEVIEHCATYATRLVFPSTSEVYGMSDNLPFREHEGPFVVGPINKQRWIYSTSKQLLERVIWAHGASNAFDFTIFRPFNWIGPGQDDSSTSHRSGARVVTQFLEDIVEGRPLQLVDGGTQSRCFTYIDDGIDCLMRILENEAGRCDGEIFNIGHPGGGCSVAELADKLISLFAATPMGRCALRLPEAVTVSAEELYGPGYEDVADRVPCIERAREILGWEPRTELDAALGRTVDAFLARAWLPVGEGQTG